MTDEELILKCAQAVTISKRGAARIIAVATPEIERRLLERMREWALTLPEHQAEALLNDLDAFAKENGIERDK